MSDYPRGRHDVPDPDYLAAVIEQLDILVKSNIDSHLREHAEIGLNAARATRPVASEGLREAALDEMAVEVIGILAEAAASIRGGVADAARTQCSREWAAQQVGYYASSAVGEAIGRFRRAALAAESSEPEPS